MLCSRPRRRPRAPLPAAPGQTPPVPPAPCRTPQAPAGCSRDPGERAWVGGAHRHTGYGARPTRPAAGTRSRQRPGARPRPDARDPRSAGRGEGGSCAGSVQMSDFGQRSASEATPPPATTCHRGQSRPQRPTPGPTSARTLEGAGAAPPKRQWVSSPQRHAGTLLISACSYTRHPRAPSPSAPRFSYESQWISASAALKSTLTPGSFRRCSQPEWEQGHRPQCSWPAPRARA